MKIVLRVLPAKERKRTEDKRLQVSIKNISNKTHIFIFSTFTVKLRFSIFFNCVFGHIFIEDTKYFFL